MLLFVLSVLEIACLVTYAIVNDNGEASGCCGIIEGSDDIQDDDFVGAVCFEDPGRHHRV